jgi:predicted dehydrogenase
MSLRLAFVGFRHGHIVDLYRRALAMPEIEVVAACEEDAATREALARDDAVAITHADYARMLADVACDAIAVGDYYAIRGQRVLDALSAGKHVVSDKPLCTRLDELDQIETLSAERDLRVVCMLDMRDSAPTITARTLILEGVIGEVHAISFGGQHPLLLGSRPAWYFEPGKHGGTINDIGIHALDAIPWITGLQFASIHAARCWNAFAPAFPHFEGAAQMMLTLENGAGVMGDVSYMMPDSSGYALPFYWRMTFWGRKGILEIATNQEDVVLALDGEGGLRHEPLLEGNPGGYLRAFLHDVAGASGEGELCTADTLRAMRTSLLAQHAADRHIFDVRLKS